MLSYLYQGWHEKAQPEKTGQLFWAANLIC